MAEMIPADVPGQASRENQRPHPAAPVRQWPEALDRPGVRRDVAALVVEAFDLREGSSRDVGNGRIHRRGKIAARTTPGEFLPSIG